MMLLFRRCYQFAEWVEELWFLFFHPGPPCVANETNLYKLLFSVGGPYTTVPHNSIQYNVIAKDSVFTALFSISFLMGVILIKPEQ